MFADTRRSCEVWEERKEGRRRKTGMAMAAARFCEERCQTVKGQFGECYLADGRIHFLDIFRSWSFGRMFYHLTNIYCTIWTNGRILFYHSTMCPSYAQSLDKWKSSISFIRSIFCYLLSQFNRLIGSMHFDKKCCSCPSLHINGGSFFPLHMLIFIGFHFGLLCSFFTKNFFFYGVFGK